MRVGYVCACVCASMLVAHCTHSPTVPSLPCRDVMCGMLFCEIGGEYQHLFTSVFVVRVEGFDSSQGSRVHCE